MERPRGTRAHGLLPRSCLFGLLHQQRPIRASRLGGALWMPAGRGAPRPVGQRIHQAPQASPNRNGQRSTWSFKDEVARSRRKTGGDSVTPPLYEAIDAEILFRSWDEAKEAASPPRPPPPATWAPHEESGTVDSEELSPGAAMSENPDAEALDRSADEPECSHGAQKSSSSSGGRLVKVLFVIALAVGFAMRGNLLWTPIAAVAAFLFTKLLPNKSALLRDIRERRKEEERAAREKVLGDRRDEGTPSRTADLLETPGESTRWMPIFLDTWWPVIERYVSSQVVGALQSILDREVPPAVSLQVSQFYLGTAAPQCSNVKALYRPTDGRMEIFELDVAMNCSGLSIIIRGSAPVVGNLTVTMNKFLLNGHVQLWMLPGERMALIGFRERPQLSIGMQVEVAQQTVETDAYSLLAAPIESIIYDSLSKLVEGRRRILFPIEIDPPLRMEAVDGDVKIRLIGCTGLPGASELSRYQVTAYNAELQVELKSRIKRSATGAPSWRSQEFVLGFGDKWARFNIDVWDVQTGELLGTAVVNGAALSDGCAGFWATAADGRPLAKRLSLSSTPWRVTVPLETPGSNAVLPGAEATVDLSVLQWKYRQESRPTTSTFRTPGPRSVIVRVLEAHNIGVSRAGTRFCQVKYNNITKDTQLIANNNHPIWNRAFVFTENTSPQARKIRFKVLGAASLAGIEKDAGFAYVGLDSLHEGEPLDQWLELGNTASGRLRVSVEVVPGLADSAEVQQRAAVQLMPEDLTLKVEVVAARGLAASDLDGSANPYVKLTYGSSMRQTQVVRDSLAPSFQHQVVFPLGGRQQSLRVECLNFDCLRGIDDSLGFALVEIGRVLERGEKEYQVKVKLQDARADLFSGDGEVLLRISRTGSFERAEIAGIDSADS